MMVDAAAVSNNAESIASNEKLSYVTDKFDVLPFNLVLQRSLCTGKADLLPVNKTMYHGSLTGKLDHIPWSCKQDNVPWFINRYVGPHTMVY